MPEYRENELCYEDYRALRTLAGWETHSEEQTRRALAAALYDVTAVEDQGRGIGKAVGEKLLAYAQSRLPPGGRTSVQLIAAEGKEGFYEKLGFRKMPGGGCGFALRRVLHGHPAE